MSAPAREGGAPRTEDAPSTHNDHANGPDQGSALATAALDYAEAGLYVFPLRVYPAKDPNKKRIQPIAAWPEASSNDPATVRDWFCPGGQWADASVAIDCGRSGLVVVDLDTGVDKDGVRKDGAAEWARLVEDQEVRATWESRTPSGGRHLFYRGDPDAPVRNSTSALAPGIDVRALGGFVIAAPSTDHRGRYAWGGEGPPDWSALPTVPSLVTRPEGRGRRARTGEDAPVNDLFTGARTYTAAQGQALAARAVERVRAATYGVDVNSTLNASAMTVGHLAANVLGWPTGEAFDRACTMLRPALAAHGWADLDDSDRATIRSGLDAGMREPHALAATGRYVSTGEPLDGFPNGLDGIIGETARPSPDGAGGAESLAEAVERAKACDGEALDARTVELGSFTAARSELSERNRREARERLDAEAHPRLSFGDRLHDATALDAIPRRSFMLRGLIWDRAVGFLGGMRQTYKTFVLVSWACHIATGTPWLGEATYAVAEPRRVLYIAAEGGSDVAERVQAWEADQGARLPEGALMVHDGVVRLNDPRAVSDLDAEFTRATEAGRPYGLVIVDTFHRCTPGVNENDSGEAGAVFGVAADWRDRHGITVLFADHTGHAGERLRGASSKGDDADFELMTRSDGEGRVTLDATKLKAVALGGDGSVPLRLAPVPAVRNALGNPSAVVARSGEASTVNLRPNCWAIPTAELPEAVREIGGGTARRAAAQDIYRALVEADDSDGHTSAQVRGFLSDCPRDHSKTTVHGALGALVTASALVTNGQGSSKRYAVLS